VTGGDRRSLFRRLVPGLAPDATARLSGVVVVSFGISIGIGIIFPLLPGFALDLGLSLSELGILVSAFGLARLAVDAAGGWIFRWMSERAAATAGAVVVALGSFLTVLAGEFNGLLLARILHGIGVALFVSAGAVYIGRETPSTHRARALGLHQGGMVLGTTFGPVVAGLLDAVGGIRLPLIVAGLIGLAAIPYSLRQFPPRSLSGRDASGGVLRVAPALRWSLAVAFLCYLLVWGIRSSVRFTLAPLFVGESLLQSTLWVSVILVILSAGDVLGFLFGGQVLDRFGRRRVLVAGFLLSGAVLAWWSLVGDVGQLVPVAVAFGIVGGLVGTAPAAMLADIAGRRASTMTTMRLAGDAGIMIGPLVAVTAVDSVGYGPAFLWHGVVVGAAAVLAATARETRAQRGDGSFDPTAA